MLRISTIAEEFGFKGRAFPYTKKYSAAADRSDWLTHQGATINPRYDDTKDYAGNIIRGGGLQTSTYAPAEGNNKYYSVSWNSASYTFTNYGAARAVMPLYASIKSPQPSTTWHEKYISEADGKEYEMFNSFLGTEVKDTPARDIDNIINQVFENNGTYKHKRGFLRKPDTYAIEYTGRTLPTYQSRPNGDFTLDYLQEFKLVKNGVALEDTTYVHDIEKGYSNNEYRGNRHRSATNKYTNFKVGSTEWIHYTEPNIPSHTKDAYVHSSMQSLDTQNIDSGAIPFGKSSFHKALQIHEQSLLPQEFLNQPRPKVGNITIPEGTTLPEFAFLGLDADKIEISTEFNTMNTSTNNLASTLTNTTFNQLKLNTQKGVISIEPNGTLEIPADITRFSPTDYSPNATFKKLLINNANSLGNKVDKIEYNLRENEQIIDIFSSEHVRGKKDFTIISKLGNKHYFTNLTADKSVTCEINNSQGINYDKFTKLSTWTYATSELSKAKQTAKIPEFYEIDAVGFDAKDIEAFLNIQNKNSAYSRFKKHKWFTQAPEPSKTDAIKLFAHLGLLKQGTPQQNAKYLSAMNKIAKRFTHEQIHGNFGGLPEGVALENLLKFQDKTQDIDPINVRKRFDPKGQKAIDFFLNNLDKPGFPVIANFALTHFAQESYNLNISKKDSLNAYIQAALESDNPDIKAAAQKWDYARQRNAEVIGRKNSGKVNPKGLEKALDNNIQDAKATLKTLVYNNGDFTLQSLLQKYEISQNPISVEYFDRAFSNVEFPNAKYQTIANAAISAGYGKGSDSDVNTLCEIYDAAQAAPPKVFADKVFDTQRSGITYMWAEVDNPQMYTIAMKVGGTCMRPGHANEAGLWESATSKDVKLCFILNEYNEPIAYTRVNYDKQAHGIYIDIVDTKKSVAQNNEEVFKATVRAVTDMAKEMNKRGEHVVNIVNFREDAYNKLTTQWNRLPSTRKILQAREYKHPGAPKTYGDNKSRIQKEVWTKKDGFAKGVFPK
ncbi:MAG: hypothetical protein LBM38_06475 [Clostridiales bacterium]|jgi:hypothetical protein|nr:hypothetical protein [Clostridiales bacterium]